MKPNTVKDAIRYLKTLTVKALDPQLSSELRPIVFEEYRRAEIALAHLIQARGEEVHFLG